MRGATEEGIIGFVQTKVGWGQWNLVESESVGQEAGLVESVSQ